MSAIHSIPKTRGTLVCPSCGRKKSIEIEKYTSCRLSVNCCCGQNFTFEIKGNPRTEAQANTAAKARPGSFNTKVLRFSIDKNGKSRPACPYCGLEKNVKIPSPCSPKVIYSINCKCGEIFRCRFEPSITPHDKRNQEPYFSFKNIPSNNADLKAFFVGSDGAAKIICGKCGFVQTIGPEKIELLKKPFWFHCKCGKPLACRIDERKSYRKPTNFRGAYVNLRTSREDAAIIENISLNGIGIRAPHGHDLEPGDFLNLVFTLNDANRTEIKHDVCVKRISQRKIGCEFIKDGAYDKKLGFFLMN